MRRTALLWLVLALMIGAAPPVSAPPESVFAKFREGDREVARQFYKKCLDIDGMAVLASAEVADEALQRTHEIVTHLLAGRPDLLGAMAKHGTRLIIIGKDQVYTDMPEYRNSPNPMVSERAGPRYLGGAHGHQLRRGEPAQPGRRPLLLPDDREHRPSTNSAATISTPRHGPDRPRLAAKAGQDLPERCRLGALEERLHRLQPRRILGQRILPVMLRLQPDPT